MRLALRSPEASSPTLAATIIVGSKARATNLAIRYGVLKETTDSINTGETIYLRSSQYVLFDLSIGFHGCFLMVSFTDRH